MGKDKKKSADVSAAAAAAAAGGEDVNPFADRKVNENPPPRHLRLTPDELFKKGKPRIDVLQEHLLLEGKLREDDVLKIVADATKILKKEPNMLEINAPVSVVGDVHGRNQIKNLKK